MEKHLNLEASKALSSLGVEVESEKWWFHKKTMGVDELCNSQKSVSLGFILANSNGGSDESIRAYNLQELFLALPAIGKKLGWNEEENLSRLRRMGWNSTPNAHTHRLTDIFLKGKMPAVSESIINLIEKK